MTDYDDAPDFCIWGTRDGEPELAPDWEAIESRACDVVRISDLAELDEMSVQGNPYSHALLVNDHGNATLYRLTLGGPVTVWEVV